MSKIGFIIEGDLDEAFFSGLLSKHTNHDFSFQKCGGPVFCDKGLRRATWLEGENHDYIFVVSDSDGVNLSEIKRRFSAIYSGCPSFNLGNLMLISIDPKKEIIFFLEEHSIRRVFSIPPESPIPFESSDPKERFAKIRKQFENETNYFFRDQDFYKDIGKLITLWSLSQKLAQFKPLHQVIGAQVRQQKLLDI